MNQPKPTKNAVTVLQTLWRIWTYSFGALVTPFLCALFIPKMYIPLICLTLALVLKYIISSHSTSERFFCPLPMQAVSRSLVVSAVIMIVIIIIYTPSFGGVYVALTNYNYRIPFIIGLIIFPVTAVICSVMVFLGHRNSLCRQCLKERGYYDKDGTIAGMPMRETRYQLGCLAVMSMLIAGIQLWYYYARYINVNYNTPDTFMFRVLPLVIYGASVFVMAGRYMSLLPLYQALGHKDNEKINALLRFMVFTDNDMLLQTDTDGQFDTPVQAVVTLNGPGNADAVASATFARLTGVADANLRYLFTVRDLGQMGCCKLYAVFLGQDTPALKTFCEHYPSAQAYTADRIDAMIRQRTIAPALLSEVYRIYKITMAWKTYTTDGRRRYAIKNYRPTFRFRDLPDWDVNYDEMHWFDVARHNEDRPLFRLRRWWRKITRTLQIATP